MSPETFVDELKTALGAKLRSVVLYGSAAAGDHMGKQSDYNLLVVSDALGLPELKAIAGPNARWVKAGNPPPLLFTKNRLCQCDDVFPIELLDIIQSHKVLHGENVLADIEVKKENLRHQLEYELRAALLKLRSGYLVGEGKAEHTLGVLVHSLAPIQVLLRAALRLYDVPVPKTKREATETLSRQIAFDSAPFAEVEALKADRQKAKAMDADKLYARYLEQVEKIVDAVNGL